MTSDTGMPMIQKPMPTASRPVRQSVAAMSQTIAGTSSPPMADPADMMDMALVRLDTNQLATVVVMTRNVPNDSPIVMMVNAR